MQAYLNIMKIYVMVLIKIFNKIFSDMTIYLSMQITAIIRAFLVTWSCPYLLLIQLQ